MIEKLENTEEGGTSGWGRGEEHVWQLAQALTGHLQPSKGTEPSEVRTLVIQAWRETQKHRESAVSLP